ncbi:MAG TPA: AAA family ATPase, partial [Blastocatellia bacterium]
MLTRIRISHFRSFGEDVGIDLRPLNVLVGANSSGKSNFVEVFCFLKDLAKGGLENALSYAGGVEYLRNLRSQPSDMIELELISNSAYSGKSIAIPGVGRIEIDIAETKYTFEFLPSKSWVQETVTHRATFIGIPLDDESAREAFCTANITIRKYDGQTWYSPHSIEGWKGQRIVTELLFRPFFVNDYATARELLIQDKLNFFGQHFLDDVGIYDFEPRRGREPMWGPGPSQLESDGENLAITLKPILDDPEKKRRFLNLIGYVLPSVSEMKTELYSDGSVLPRFSEVYDPEAFLPATVMSDGTMSATALIVALYFMDNPLVIIEEPDRSLHPSLSSAVMGIIKEASERKQMIITTRSAELLKHVH